MTKKWKKSSMKPFKIVKEHKKVNSLKNMDGFEGIN